MDVNSYYNANLLHCVQHIQEALKQIWQLCHDAEEGENVAYLVNAATKLGEVAESLLPNRPTGEFPANVITVDFQARRRA